MGSPTFPWITRGYSRGADNKWIEIGTVSGVISGPPQLGLHDVPERLNKLEEEATSLIYTVAEMRLQLLEATRDIADLQADVAKKDAEIAREKERRIKYQDIVYCVCSYLDTCRPINGPRMIADKEAIMKALRGQTWAAETPAAKGGA